MPFAPGDFIDICVRLFPTVTGLYLNDRKSKRDAEVDKFKIAEMSRLEKMEGSGSFEPKSKKAPESGALPEGWEEGESVDELGHRFWLGYHGAIDSLPEDATKSQVQHILKKITENVKEFPCPSCRESAVEILENDPLVKSEIETKKDAQIALCEFHNHISDHLGKETVSCEQTYV